MSHTPDTAGAGTSSRTGETLPMSNILLDPAAMLARINGALPAGTEPYRQCRVTGLHYKNPRRRLVGYAVRHDDEQEQELYLYARSLDAAEYPTALARAHVKRWTPSVDGPTLTPMDDLSAILYWFPNDERLDGLKRLADRKKLQRLMYARLPQYPASHWRISDRSFRLRTVRHKPERRAVAHCRFRVHPRHGEGREERFAYISVHHPERAAALWKSLVILDHAARERGEHWGVPEPMGWSPEDGLLIVAEQPGASLRTVLTDGDDARAKEIIDVAGAALAELHAGAFDGFPTMTPQQYADLLTDSVSMLATLAPDAARQAQDLCTALEARLSSGQPAASAFIHGDLHPGQVIAGDGRVALLDFDRSHIGAPGMDLGNFAAQLWLAEGPAGEWDSASLNQRFVAAYRRLGGQVPEESELACWEAFGLLRCATVPYGRCEPDWQAQMQRILQRAEDLIA